jgi:prepilin-type N-terminal cleavage/methylation domain-containing protein
MSPRRAAGFTLVEIIIATVLFGFLMTAYYEVFINVVELEEYARSSRSFSAVGPAVLDLIEDDVLSLYTHPRAAEAFPFRGTDDSLASQPADRLQFVAMRASVQQEEFFGRGNWVRSPINEVGYRLARNVRSLGNVRKLYRRETYYVDEAPLEGGDYYEVYDHVVSFNVDYAGYRVEEEERTNQDTLGEHQLEKFESWDSVERRGFPTALIVTLTIEPPQLQVVDRDSQIEPERRTFVRVIPLIQADDIAPQPATETQPGTTPNPNSTPGR